MKTHYQMGIDIGGTNTDAVLIDADGKMVACAKTTTTQSIEIGFEACIKELLSKANVDRSSIQNVFAGTTHAINAILEVKGLKKVSIVRIAGHKPKTLPPCLQWPKALKEAVLRDIAYLDGGFECDGRAITPFNEKKAKKEIKKLLESGSESIAVSGVFSPLYAKDELLVREIIQSIQPDFPVSLSHEIGGIGFLERENAAVLNACLKQVMADSFNRLIIALKASGLSCPLHICQNNGSAISIAKAIDCPILTLSAGPTNSFIGGAKLAKVENAIIVDIGGTSTDVGIIHNGFARRSLNRATIGGVLLSLPFPDVLSIGLGGGSLIDLSERISIGPRSCSKQLKEEAISFKGDKLTLTDIALKLGTISIPEADPGLVSLDERTAEKIMQQAYESLLKLVSKMDMRRLDLPVVLVGGGAPLLDLSKLPSRFQMPAHAHVANAYGASLAEISSTVDKMVALNDREKILSDLKEIAMSQAIEKGACPRSARIIEQQVIPYHYMPGNQARVIISAAGKLNSLPVLKEPHGDFQGAESLQ